MLAPHHIYGTGHSDLPVKTGLLMHLAYSLGQLQSKFLLLVCWHHMDYMLHPYFVIPIQIINLSSWDMI